MNELEQFEQLINMIVDERIEKNHYKTFYDNTLKALKGEQKYVEKLKERIKVLEDDKRKSTEDTE